MKKEMKGIRDDNANYQNKFIVVENQQVQLHDYNKVQEEKLNLLTNIVIKQDEAIQNMQTKLLNTEKRAMHSNLIISGIPEERGENCRQLVEDFFKCILNCKETIQFQTAHCMGDGNPKPMVVRLIQPEDKQKTYPLLKNLRGVKNSDGKLYFVNDQLPEELGVNDRCKRQIIPSNKKLPVSHQLSINFKKGELTINNETHKPKVAVPNASRLLKYPDDEKHADKKIRFYHSDTARKEGSSFTTFAIKVDSFEEVRCAYRYIKYKNPTTSHISCAFRLPGMDPHNKDFCDNREQGAAGTFSEFLKKKRSTTLQLCSWSDFSVASILA